MSLINREALLEAYDAEHKGPAGRARTLIEEAPTVDAVEVVKCRDCKYCLPYNNTIYCSHYPYRECYVIVEKNDYCSYGERRTE